MCSSSCGDEDEAADVSLPELTSTRHTKSLTAADVRVLGQRDPLARLTLSRSSGCVQQAAPHDAIPPKYQRDIRFSVISPVTVNLSLSGCKRRVLSRALLIALGSVCGSR